MGNVDTKLQFRKAIVQLGNKNHVNIPKQEKNMENKKNSSYTIKF